MSLRYSAVLALTLLATACSKDEAQTPAPKIEGLPEAEVERARQACQAYVARLCACAETEPELESQCVMAKARPEALELNIAISQGGGAGLTKTDMAVVKQETRKIAAACLEAEGRIRAGGCPRHSK